MRIFIGLLMAFVGFGALAGFKVGWDILNNATEAAVCLNTMETLGLASFGTIGLLLVFVGIYKSILDPSGRED